MSKPDEKRILVTGSRAWNNRKFIRDILKSVYKEHPDAVLVTGACPRGADYYASDEWLRLGGIVEEHPASWGVHDIDCSEWCKSRPHCRKAGFRRNAEMVELKPIMCLAFIRDNSPGSTYTVGLAEQAGIVVHRYDYVRPKLFKVS